MNFKTAKAHQQQELAPDPARPREVEVAGSELAAWAVRESTGEFHVTAMDVVANGRYRLELRWPENKKACPAPGDAL